MKFFEKLLKKNTEETIVRFYISEATYGNFWGIIPQEVSVKTIKKWWPLKEILKESL